MRRVLKALGFGDDCFYTQKFWSIFLYSASTLNKSVRKMYVVINVITIVSCMPLVAVFGGEISTQTYSMGWSSSGCYRISHI